MTDKKDLKMMDLIAHRLSLKYNIRKADMLDIVEAQFRFTQETISKLDIENLTLEELEELKTNFLYKHLGKLYINPLTTIKKLEREELKFKKNGRDSIEKTN